MNPDQWFLLSVFVGFAMIVVAVICNMVENYHDRKDGKDE